eukprot:SAG31_NODE_489_length_14938_cov_5.644113_8_plen_65_part_00
MAVDFNLIIATGRAIEPYPDSLFQNLLARILRFCQSVLVQSWHGPGTGGRPISPQIPCQGSSGT